MEVAGLWLLLIAGVRGDYPLVAIRVTEAQCRAAVEFVTTGQAARRVICVSPSGEVVSGQGGRG